MCLSNNNNTVMPFLSADRRNCDFLCTFSYNSLFNVCRRFV